MFNRLMKIALGLAVPVALIAASPALAEIREHQLKFAAANNKGHPQVMGMEKFAELVKDKSGGKIEVKLFPGGVLGGDVQTVSALQGGVIEMTVLNAGILASNVKQFGAVDLPFLFNNGEEADKVMDGPFGTGLADLLPDTGLVGLGYWEHPVTKIEDIKGLKIRTIQSPIPIELFNNLGANAVPLPYTELYTALETGTVDGQENPAANILNAKFYEVQKYMTVTRHQYNPQIVLISKKFWDGLNDEEKVVLQTSATEARDYQRQVSREFDAKAIADIKATGMEVSELSPEETQKLRDAVKPMIEKFSAEIGPDTVAALFKELQTLRGQ
ncbi:ABC transporter substrate-binding protein [Ensifer sp. Root31]|uniref:TRAP transporter substrate-binding protein n=1 Tax=Ensifer sp. Root31 TaxID=1736512 RepID=UPI00070926DE|nr:TRAP transporter substrate-binding protein [Ensifer sp. Root31]KQU82058.1 ABC transporter substrate-binding protein [Ensifer sp. Root31]